MVVLFDKTAAVDGFWVAGIDAGVTKFEVDEGETITDCEAILDVGGNTGGAGGIWWSDSICVLATVVVLNPESLGIAGVGGAETGADEGNCGDTDWIIPLSGSIIKLFILAIEIASCRKGENCCDSEFIVCWFCCCNCICICNWSWILPLWAFELSLVFWFFWDLYCFVCFVCLGLYDLFCFCCCCGGDGDGADNVDIEDGWTVIFDIIWEDGLGFWGTRQDCDGAMFNNDDCGADEFESCRSNDEGETDLVGVVGEVKDDECENDTLLRLLLIL